MIKSLLNPAAAYGRQGFFFSSFLPYFGALFLIVLWWSAAFQGSTQAPNDLLSLNPIKPAAKTSILPLLSPLKRDVLNEALRGDFSLMTKLIAEWDIDAQMMQAQGLRTVKRLPKDSYVKAQLLGRQLKKSSNEELKALHQAYRKPVIHDALKKPFDLKDPPQKFLPQTYIAATFLLALTSTDNIVAIPKGLREQKSFFPAAVTDKVNLDIDRYNAEKLFKCRPDIAFVSHYSHPNTLQALKSQGIQLFTVKSLETIPEIQETLVEIGHVINRPLEAELLNLFIEASMLAIDNRVVALNLQFDQDSKHPKVLFLNHHIQYSIPTGKTLTGQLLARAGLSLYTPKGNFNDWSLTVEQEQILKFDPDCLIIASPNGESPAGSFLKERAFKQLNAVKNGRVYFVDEQVQQSPTQFVVLAYYDLFQALASAYPP